MAPIDEQAEYAVRLVQGTQALEGNALDAEGRKRLLELAKRLVLERLQETDVGEG